MKKQHSIFAAPDGKHYVVRDPNTGTYWQAGRKLTFGARETAEVFEDSGAAALLVRVYSLEMELA